MFVNKLLTFLGCAYLKKLRVLYCEIFKISFSHEDEDIDRFSNPL